jgi:hypothetical protein
MKLLVVFACALSAHATHDGVTSTTHGAHRSIIEATLATSADHFAAVCIVENDVEKLEDESGSSELAMKPGFVNTLRPCAPELTSVVGAHTARSSSVRRVRAHLARGPPTVG